MRYLVSPWEAEDTLVHRPEVQAGRGVLQNNWHKKDVLDHTVHVVRLLKEMGADKKLVALGYLHDIGKPKTALPDIPFLPNYTMHDTLLYTPPSDPILANGHISYSFHGHEKAGKKLVEAMPAKLFTQLELDQAEMAELVGEHGVIMHAAKRMKLAQSNKKEFRNFYCKLDSELREPQRDYLLRLFHANTLAQGNPSDLPFLVALHDDLAYGEIGGAAYEKLPR